jgi:cytidylate kinase
MPSTLIPSVEQRISTLLEVTRRLKSEPSSMSKPKGKSTITISREFGCEAFPVAEHLKALLEMQSGETWAVMDKALLEEVARNNALSEDILRDLGRKPRFLDEMIATFTPRWKSDQDYYQLLCRHIVLLAKCGNVIIVGRGAAIITQSMENCNHFRMVAPLDYRVHSIARRLAIPPQEAQDLVQKGQQQRDKFMNNFLNIDSSDPTNYHLVLNNGKSSPEKIANTIFHFIS